jgi:hypothetical protein
MRLPITARWAVEPATREFVLLSPAYGPTGYLLWAHREQCAYCGTGERLVSLWAMSEREGEEVAWCRHCFNATCDDLSLNEAQREQFEEVRAALSQGRSARTWGAVRPALEDLERRGLL